LNPQNIRCKSNNIFAIAPQLWKVLFSRHLNWAAPINFGLQEYLLLNAFPNIAHPIETSNKNNKWGGAFIPQSPFPQSLLPSV